MSRPLVVGFVRTPIGRFGGSLRDLKPSMLGAVCIRALLDRAGLEPRLVDEVIVGCALQGGAGQNVARQAALLAGLPDRVNAYTINRVCSSGMQALIEACRHVALGDASIVVAAGVESMSTCPLAITHEARWGIRHCVTRRLELVDLMVLDGLVESLSGRLMGELADEAARRHGIDRELLDWIAYESNRRAWHATVGGLFRDLEPVDVGVGGRRVRLEVDECIRPDTSIERLRELRPVFTSLGPHTAGNSSKLGDGAAALLIASESAARELGLRPVARVVGYAEVSTDPTRFVEAPIHAIRLVLERVGWGLSDVDAFEVNEAFAVVPALVNRFLGVPYEKMNILGGAIALGHPLGATGARIVTTLIAALASIGGRRGVAALCHGGGGATAIALELV